MIKSKISLLPLIICVFLPLLACGPSGTQKANNTATSTTDLASGRTATPSSTITSMPTITPVLSHTSTFVPTLAPTATKTQIPTKTPDPNRFYAADGYFSLVPPTGWLPVDIGMTYPSLVGFKTGNYSPNLVFTMENYPFLFDFYTAKVQDSLKESLKNVVQIREDFLTTNAGKDYFRWVIEDTQQGVVFHQAYYFFESGDWKLTITYSRTRNQGSVYDPMGRCSHANCSF